MPKKRIDLPELKLIQLSILKEVDDFCKKNNIQYFMFAGTLLGAVRHKGYIPWDDDIDLCMKRNDYNRFVTEFKGVTTDVLTYINSKKYFYPFAKVVKKDTFVTEEFDWAKNLGINIDVFQIDNIPDDFSQRKKYFKQIEKYRKILSLKIGFNKRSFFKKLFLIVYFIMRLAPTKYTCLKKINQVASQYSNDTTKCCCEAIWGLREKGIVPSSCFSESVNLVFEGNYYPAPIGYTEWLSIAYGDFMSLPPENQRITNHNREDYVIINSSIDS